MYVVAMNIFMYIAGVFCFLSVFCTDQSCFIAATINFNLIFAVFEVAPGIIS
jgi:hypothetical protein